MKTIGNRGFLRTLNAMGRRVPVNTPPAFTIANKINGFEHVSYGTALNQFYENISIMSQPRGLCLSAE